MAYFWYDGYGDGAARPSERAGGDTQPQVQVRVRRLWHAAKQTIVADVLFAVLLLGLLALEVRLAEGRPLRGPGGYLDFVTNDNCKHLLLFTSAMVALLGLLAYVLYTPSGVAVLPIRLLRSAFFAPTHPRTVVDQLALTLQTNQQRQTHLTQKCRGNTRALSARDRAVLNALIAEDRVASRRLHIIKNELDRLGPDQQQARQPVLPLLARVRLMCKLEPVQGLTGSALLVLLLLVLAAVLLDTLGRATYFVCGGARGGGGGGRSRCAALLQHLPPATSNPLDWLFTQSARLFPLDLALLVAVTLFLLAGSVFGLVVVLGGLRIFSVNVVSFRRGPSSAKGRGRGQIGPQDLLLATTLIALAGAAVAYMLATVLAPRYAAFGTQRFCDHPSSSGGQLADCAGRLRSAIRPCGDTLRHQGGGYVLGRGSDHGHDRGHPQGQDREFAAGVCTPSKYSRFVRGLAGRFPFVEQVNLYAQLAFIVIYITALILSIRAGQHLAVAAARRAEDADEAQQEAVLAERSETDAWSRLLARLTANETAYRSRYSYGSSGLSYA
ncbi:putative lysosomal cobalamin transporter [Ascosphaera acerosa]|nr:putative lysosomal cobalamin transporter [Ascosphaera acerosa]